MTVAARAGAENARTRFAALKRLGEWLWRSDALRNARSIEPSLDASVRVPLARAEAALACAAQIAAGKGAETSAADALALSLYREAAYWALCARAGGQKADDLAGAFASLSPEACASLPTAVYEDARAALLERDFVASSALDAIASAQDVKAAHAFVDALLDALATRERRELSLLRQRVLRVATLLGSILVLLLGLLIVPARMRRDLAASALWRASSGTLGFPGQGRGGSAPNETSLFFHTEHEKTPWIEFDLERARTLHSVRLVNRADCCQERAAPLVIELSNDRHRYHRVAERDELFYDWSVRLASEQARYLRVRALNPTSLHLTRVEIH